MIWVGTSGFQYPEWRGSFYPEGMPEKRMLEFYTQHFSTVEINYSFYRLPDEKTLEGWLEGTPEHFRLTLKAPRRITHGSRLTECGDLVGAFCSRFRLLGDKGGAMLFKVPVNKKKELSELQGLLECLPKDLRACLDFRSDTWFSEDVYDLLRAHHAALCISDTEALSTPLVQTADWTYFRLRDEGYRPEDIRRWAGVIRPLAEGDRDSFVYFKHEEQGKGPEFAKELLAALA